MFYAPLRKRGARPVTLLIASIGVTMMIQGAIRLFFGVGDYSFFEHETKAIIRIPTAAIGGSRDITFTQPQLLMIIFTVAICLALHFFLTRSRLGKAMRAMSDNADLAQGFARVVIVSPLGLAGALPTPYPLREVVTKLREAGAQVHVLAPDAESIAAMGFNPLDPSTRAAAASAGRAQGRTRPASAI